MEGIDGVLGHGKTTRWMKKHGDLPVEGSRLMEQQRKNIFDLEQILYSERRASFCQKIGVNEMDCME